MIITSYYPPEIGAASNRIAHMAKGLNEIGFVTSVVTPLPNYPTGKIFKDYRGKFIQKSQEEGGKVYRLWIFASNSKNKIHRFLAMVSYSLSLIWFFIFHKIPKTVIVQSPPLLVAFTCMLFLKSRKRKLVLNVSDLWPSAGLELGVFKENFSYRLLEKIEKFNYKRANLVLGQSQEILDHVLSIIPNKETFLYRNYPDFSPPDIQSYERETNKITVVYAGLLGVAQGVLKLCEELDFSNIELHIYGSGAEEKQILNFIESHNNLPIFYHGQVERTMLHVELLKYDVAIIPLLNRIYGSVPSKIFEYARLGLPVIYFGGGEGEALIRKYDLGWVVDVGNYRMLNELFKNLEKYPFNLNKRKNIQEVSLEKFHFRTQLLELKNTI